MMYVGDNMSTSGGYHEYIRDVQYIEGYHFSPPQRSFDYFLLVDLSL